MATAFDATLQNLGIGRTGQAATAAASGKSTLGQSDFLKLMTAQLKNQDPFSPVDNTQMIAQMAQFSSVAGIAEMNATLSGIATKLGATSTADAMAYVGRTVLTEGSVAYPRSTGGIAGAIELDADATDVNVTIADATGALVRSMKLGPATAGTLGYDWDGMADTGQPAGAGPFTVTVQAAANGTTVKSRGLVWAPVESVSLPANGSPVLQVTGLGPVAVSAVRQAG
jgi:flagellar basal-body rod modification protein FlgD